MFGLIVFLFSLIIALATKIIIVLFIGIGLLAVILVALNIVQAGKDADKQSDSKSDKNSSSEDVLKALKLRYVRGEITKNQYEKIKKDLE